jgi:hypothetical protein
MKTKNPSAQFITRKQAEKERDLMRKKKRKEKAIELAFYSANV